MSQIWQHYRNIIHGTTNPVVVEIGAADGQDTERLQLPLAATGRNWRLLAFECEPKNFDKFKQRNIDSVEFFPVAVSDHDGPGRWVGSGNWPYSGSLKEPVIHRVSHAWIPFEQPTEVPCVMLDTMFKTCRLDHIDFIWMDVQGAEDLVLAGGQHALAKTRWIWAEVYEDAQYEGPIGKEGFLSRLPGRWEIEFIESTDILFHNLDFP